MKNLVVIVAVALLALFSVWIFQKPVSPQSNPAYPQGPVEGAVMTNSTGAVDPRVTDLPARREAAQSRQQVSALDGTSTQTPELRDAARKRAMQELDLSRRVNN